MEHKLLAYKNSEISYYRFGTGPRKVICFHGYAEEASNFTFLEQKAGEQFSFYAIDLPYHGKTIWKEGLNFNHKDLAQIVQDIYELKNLKHTTASAAKGLPQAQQNLIFSLLGFSLGGRIALSLYQSIPEQIDKLVLLAPDGLKINFWYWLSTQTWIGNRLFAFTMKHPGWFFGFLKGLNKLGVVNASVFKFVNFYICDPFGRRLLYERWTALRKLKPNIERVKSLIRRFKTPVRLVYGKHDRIILPVRGKKFRKGIEEHCKIIIIESGHQVLHPKHASEIIHQLKE